VEVALNKGVVLLRAVVLLGSFLDLAHAAQPVLPADVRREVLGAHERLAAFLQNVEVSFRTTYQRHTRGGQAAEESHGTFRLAGPWRAIESYNAKDSRKSVRAYNSKYSFFMGRSEGRPQDELFQYDRSGALQTPVVEEVDLKVSRYLGAAHTVMYYYSLVDFLESRGSTQVALREVKSYEERGQKRIQVVFDRKDGGRTYPCWAVLDPSNHWAVVEAVVQWPWGEAVQTVEYNPAVRDVPFPRRVVYVTRAPSKGWTEREEWSFDDPKPCTATEEAFTLTAYGLPEVVQEHWGLRGIFLAATAILLVAMIAHYVRRRRLRGRAASEPQR
jgi:hypothetical protein